MKHKNLRISFEALFLLAWMMIAICLTFYFPMRSRQGPDRSKEPCAGLQLERIFDCQECSVRHIVPWDNCPHFICCISDSAFSCLVHGYTRYRRRDVSELEMTFSWGKMKEPGGQSRSSRLFSSAVPACPSDNSRLALWLTRLDKGRSSFL